LGAMRGNCAFSSAPLHPRMSSVNSMRRRLVVCSKILRETNCSYLTGCDSGDSDSFFANEIESDEEQKERVVMWRTDRFRAKPVVPARLANRQ
jgi:hypothetical protein